LTLREVAVRFPSPACIMCLCLAVATAAAQTSGPPPSPAVPPTPPHRGDINQAAGDEDEATTRITRDMEKKAAKDRVASLKNDTDKLLRLSVELKQYVDKSDQNVLSLDVIKKAEEIEKLAKSVKEKMKGPN